MQERAPIFYRAQKIQFFQAPVFVAGDDKGGDSRPHLFQVVEYAAIDGLFFKGPEEPFLHTISLWFRDEGETWGYPPKTVLLEKMVGKILRAVAHAQGQPSGHIRPHVASILAGKNHYHGSYTAFIMGPILVRTFLDHHKPFIKRYPITG